MTVIAVATDGQTAWMAADSCSTDGNDRAWPLAKIARKQAGDATALVAVSGADSLLQTVRWKLALEPPSGGLDEWAWQAAEQFTTLAVEAKPPITDKDGYVDGRALLACKGRLWMLTGHDATSAGRFTAIGSGGDLALGALTVLLAADWHPADAVAKACEVACQWNSGCRPPIQTEHT